MWVRIVSIAGVLLLAAVAVLGAMRVVHDRELDRLWDGLRLPAGDAIFDPLTLDDLPEPARRYFLHAIAPGTRIARSVVIAMEGRIGLKPGSDKLAFRADSILAPPLGMIWKASASRDVMRISGNDHYAEDAGSMRWFLWHVIPMVNANGPDVTRSAAGRVAIEAAAFLPSALLPTAGVRWEPVDDGSARVRMRIGVEEVAVVLTVQPDGRLERVEALRWDAAGMDGKPGYVPWLADELTEERSFGGYTIPTRMRVTKRAGTPQADAFFEAAITAAAYQ